LAVGVAEDLAVLGRDGGPDLRAAAQQGRAEVEQDARPAGQGRRAPGPPGHAGRGDGGVDVRLAGVVDAGGDGAQGGVEDLALTCRWPGPGLALDPVGDALFLDHLAASAFTARSASMSRARPSRASASLIVSGGAIRRACPYRPPLPMS